MIHAAVRAWTKAPMTGPIRKVRAVLLFPLALSLMLPLAILLAVAFYLRATIISLGALLGLASQGEEEATIQAPHFMDEISKTASRQDGGHRH